MPAITLLTSFLLASAFPSGPASPAAAPVARVQETTDAVLEEVKIVPWVAEATSAQLDRRLLTLQVEFKPTKIDQHYVCASPVQVGTVVAPGRVVTSYAGLQGHRRVESRALGKKVSLELLACSAKDDVALLGPKRAADEEALKALTPLHLDSDLDWDSAEAFTLFTAPDTKEPPYVIGHGELRFDEDGPLHPLAITHFGGLPVVDGNGGLLGLWLAPLPGEEPSLVPTAVVLELIEDSKSATPRFLPTGRAAPSYSFPQVRWEKAGKNGGSNYAMEQAKKLRAQIECSRCHGAGELDEQKVTDPDKRRRRRGGKFPCPDCQRNQCLKDKKEVARRATIMAGAFAKMKPNAKHFESALEKLESGVEEAASLNRAYFEESVRDAARERLKAHKAIPGQAVAMLINEDEWPEQEVGAWGHSMHFLEVDGISIILKGTRSRNVTNEANHAFVVGAISGTLYIDDRHWVVVERAIAVPLRRSDD